MPRSSIAPQCRKGSPVEAEQSREGAPRFPPTPPPPHTPALLKNLSPQTPTRPRDAGYPERYAFNAITVADTDIHRPRLLRHVTAVWTDPPAHRGRAKGEAMTSSSCLPRPVTRCNAIPRSVREPYVHMYMRPAFSSPPAISPAERSASAHCSPAAGCAYGCAYVCFPAVCQRPAKRAIFIAFGMSCYTWTWDMGWVPYCTVTLCIAEFGVEGPRCGSRSYHV